MCHNSNLFGSCIIHILYTECAKIKKNNSSAKRINISQYAAYELNNYYFYSYVKYLAGSFKVFSDVVFVIARWRTILVTRYVVVYLYTEFDVAVCSGSLVFANTLEEKCTLNEISTLEYYKENIYLRKFANFSSIS